MIGPTTIEPSSFYHFQSKDLLKVDVSAAREEVESAFEKAKSFEFETLREKAAFEDCKILMDDALKELQFFISKERIGRYIIYVKAGVYDETIILTKKMANIAMFDDGSQKTIITRNKNFVDGVNTFQTVSFATTGEAFMAMAMGFKNTARLEKHRALTLEV